MSTKKPTIRCIHRHTIEEHPQCFANGELNENQVKLLEAETNKPWFIQDDYKIGYVDIETDGLKADFSTMLSWSIKEANGKNIYDVITRKELFNGTTDQRILETLIDEMQKYKILVGYYSTKFDIPFVRTKALHYGMDFPEYGSAYHFDVFYVVKSKLCLSRKSLESACDYLNIKGKTPLDREVWRLAKYGDPAALAKVVEHNLGDTEILEVLHNKLTPFVKWTRRSV